MPHYRSWIYSNKCCDYFPIFLELELDDSKPCSPFKFNPRWIKEEDFTRLVKEILKLFDSSLDLSAGEQFVLDLKIVKRKVAS